MQSIILPLCARIFFCYKLNSEGTSSNSGKEALCMHMIFLPQSMVLITAQHWFIPVKQFMHWTCTLSLMPVLSNSAISLLLLGFLYIL
jgi:hypothetical protein